MTGLFKYSPKQCLIHIIGTLSALLGFLIEFWTIVADDEIHTTKFAPRCFFLVGVIALSCHLWIDMEIRHKHEYHKYRNLYCFLYIISVITSSFGFIFTLCSMAVEKDVPAVKWVNMCMYIFSSVTMFTHIWINMHIQYEAEVSRQRFRL